MSVLSRRMTLVVLITLCTRDLHVGTTEQSTLPRLTTGATLTQLAWSLAVVLDMAASSQLRFVICNWGKGSDPF